VAESEVSPFRVEVPQEDVDDLRDRLLRTRWPVDQDLPGERGIPLARVRELAERWATSWEWRAWEASLNAVPQVVTTIDGTTVHALHARSADPDAVPLVLLHGWPGSVVEFLRVLEPLGEFSLVVPSLPGFGFSGPTPDGGWTPERMARAVAELVHRLGYDRYVVHGGDWGSHVGRDVARVDGRSLLGLHVTMTPGVDVSGDPTAAEKWTRYGRDLAGYNKLQSTRPLSLAPALTDSPAGLLAWIAERFAEWTDPASDIDEDQLLADVAVYWFTRTGPSSAQIYWERQHAPTPEWARDVPTGVAVLPHDLARPPRAAMEAAVDLVSWTEFDRGGHFPAMEVPDLLADELRRFVRAVRP
jgi:pimeloyl-ACP methyl ester carboxylesterase